MSDNPTFFDESMLYPSENCPRIKPSTRYVVTVSYCSVSARKRIVRVNENYSTWGYVTRYLVPAKRVPFRYEPIGAKAVYRGEYPRIDEAQS